MPAIPDGGEDAAGNVLEQGMGVIGTADSVFTWGGYFQAIAILFCIIGLLWFALWFLKRRGGIQKLGILSRDLTIESRLALGAKNYLIVVRFLNKRLLLGVSDQRITLLTELADDEDEQAGNTHAAGDAASFRDALRAARKNGEDEA